MRHSMASSDSKIFPQTEIEATFARYVAAIERNDWDQALLFFSEAAEGGNSRLGVLPGNRDGVLQFMASARADWSLHCVWHTTAGNTVLYQWRQVLPGLNSSGEEFSFHGYCELHYSGLGQFDWLYSFPDTASMKHVKQEWAAYQGESDTSNKA